MANSRNSTISTAFWVARVAFFFVGFFSLAGAARAVVPAAAEVLSTALLRFWAAAQPWLSPPYLFITVHLIILLIWKLSDQVHHHHAVRAAPFEPSTTAQIQRIKIPSSPALPLYYNHIKAAPLDSSSPLLRKSLSEKRSKSKSPRSPTSLASLMHGNHVKAGPFEPPLASPLRRKPSMERRYQIPSPPATPSTPAHVNIAPLETSDFEFENESMELKWNKSKFVKATWKPITPAMVMPAVDGEEDSDELNRRFDEFIKKKYDQMRLESNHHRPAAAATEQ